MPEMQLGVTPDHRDWESYRITEAVLGEARGDVPRTWATTARRRLRKLRDELRRSWAGLDRTEAGPLTDWVLAGLLARENVLLLGPPGTAKTQIATQTYEYLGLKKPLREDVANWGPPPPLEDVAGFVEWWESREELACGQQRYFSYLLSKFTEPEELLGPIEIDLLRQGIFVRVNFGLMTGKGVRAVFLDEIFKSSSSILNALLGMANERMYFNWGGMVRSDLNFLIGASNEIPGGLSAGGISHAGSNDEFLLLYAFLDRLVLRLRVPVADAHTDNPEGRTPLEEATKLAIDREALLFATKHAFSDRPSDVAGMNDVLLLGRQMMEHRRSNATVPFDQAALAAFQKSFQAIAADLKPRGTDLHLHLVKWTISPRKLKALYKISLAHAIVRTDSPDAAVRPDGNDLRVFQLIWDSPSVEKELADLVRGMI